VIPRHADDALHQIGHLGPAVLGGRRLEHDDVAGVDCAEVDTELVDDYAITDLQRRSIEAEE